MKKILLWSLFAAMVSSPAVLAQEPPESKSPDEQKPDKRVFGVLPNYRMVDGTGPIEPLTTKQKFYIGFKDSTDYPVYGVSAAFAGLYQLRNSHPSYGQGAAGYFKRLGSSYADQSIGNMMTESIMPTVLHEDPRYFRKGTGSILSRIGYATSRILVTRTDSGGTSFNFAEVGGNAITAAIGNAYYPHERTLGDNAERLYTSLATDALSQVLKEFWPDVKRKFFKKK